MFHVTYKTSIYLAINKWLKFLYQSGGLVSVVERCSGAVKGSTIRMEFLSATVTRPLTHQNLSKLFQTQLGYISIWEIKKK